MCPFIYNYHTSAPNRCPGAPKRIRQFSMALRRWSLVKLYLHGGFGLNCTCMVGGTLGWSCRYRPVLLRAFVLAWLPGVKLYPSSLCLGLLFSSSSVGLCALVGGPGLCVGCRPLGVFSLVCLSGCLSRARLSLPFVFLFVCPCLVVPLSSRVVRGLSLLFVVLFGCPGIQPSLWLAGCVVCVSFFVFLSFLFSRPRAASLAMAHIGFLEDY